MSELPISNSLYISAIGEDDTSYYYLSLNTENLMKFYSSSSRIYYSPSSLKYCLVKQNNGYEEGVAEATLSLTISGYNLEDGNVYSEEITKTQESANIFEYEFSRTDINIETITISASYRGLQVAYKELPVVYGTNEQMAKFALVANGIYASVEDAGFSFTSSGLTITNGNIAIKNEENREVFRADSKGNLYFEGTINSQDGFLSGWVLEEDELIDESGQVGIHSGSRRHYGDDESPVRFWAGTSVSEPEISLLNDDIDYNFVVTENGTLYANNAKIIGDIRATSGHILSNFYVGANSETGIILHADETSSYIGSMRYASGALGGGWTINSDGSAEFNNVSVRGKITSSVFEYGHISSIGGSLYVAPTIYTTSNSAAITKENNQYFVSWTLESPITEAFGGLSLKIGDYLLLDGSIFLNGQIIHLSNISLIVEELSTIGNAISPNTLKASFSYGDNELVGAVFQPATTIVFYGTAESRNGLYLTAMGENAPYLEIYSNNNESVIPSVRLGNLSGIQDSNFASVSGGRLSGYGLYSSNAYLRGQLVLPSAGVTNQNEIRVENSPIRIWAGTSLTDDITKSNFIVTEDGSLYAKRGIFEGVVRAVDSEFSGSIRAAGILLEEEDISSDDSLHDHFYIAYNILDEGETEFTPSYKNYVLNIDKNGLSIWEGGLQAYSDFANGENTLGEQQAPLAAYKYNETTKSAFPFLYLVDDGTAEKLTSRLIVNKAHILNFTPEVENGKNYYNLISAQINDGYWLYGVKQEIDDSCENIERIIFDKKDSGLTLVDNTKLLLKNTIPNGSILLNSTIGTYINSTNDDLENYLNNALFVRGNVQIASSGKAELNLNSAMIQEAKNSSDKTIGLNFVAVS